MSPARVSPLCPISLLRPGHGDVTDSNPVPARMPALGAPGCILQGSLVPAPSPALLGHASPRPRWPQPQTPTWAPACSPVSDPGSSEKLLCGAMKGGGGGGGGGRRGCPGEGMLFSSSLLFPGLANEQIKGLLQQGRVAGGKAEQFHWGGHGQSRDRFTLPCPGGDSGRPEGPLAFSLPISTRFPSG